MYKVRMNMFSMYSYFFLWNPNKIPKLQISILNVSPPHQSLCKGGRTPHKNIICVLGRRLDYCFPWYSGFPYAENCSCGKHSSMDYLGRRAFSKNEKQWMCLSRGEGSQQPPWYKMVFEQLLQIYLGATGVGFFSLRDM